MKEIKKFGSDTLPKATEKELLTVGKMKSLFGAAYKDIVYFNFDTGLWNRSSYLGFGIGNQNIDTRNALEMKSAVEKESEMQGREVVASVVKAVDRDDYPGDGRISSGAKYKRSSNVIGTLVLRDKNTGKILPIAPCWLGVEAYPMVSVAAFYGADGLGYKLANNAKLRNLFLSELSRQTQR